jgi:hypothetical protein
VLAIRQNRMCPAPDVTSLFTAVSSSSVHAATVRAIRYSQWLLMPTGICKNRCSNITQLCSKLYDNFIAIQQLYLSSACETRNNTAVQWLLLLLRMCCGRALPNTTKLHRNCMSQCATCKALCKLVLLLQQTLYKP